MKILLDFLPILLFFATFKWAEGHRDLAAVWATTHLGALVSGGAVGPAEAPVLLATLVVILATFVQILVLLALRRKIEPMLWVSLALVSLLGGATIWFHSEAFIKWKPTLLYWISGSVLGLAQWLFGRNLLQAMLGAQMPLPAAVWQRLTGLWVGFFALMGGLNLWVAHRFSTDAWVNFKLFGGMGLMFAFVLGQGLYLARHLPDGDTPGHDTPPRDPS